MQKIINLFKEALNSEEKDFTSGSINKALVLLAIPMILEMLMESLFAVVDVFFVAQVGIEAVSTVGLTESVITLVYSVGIGMSMAATAMVARRIGGEEPRCCRQICRSSHYDGIGYFRTIRDSWIYLC